MRKTPLRPGQPPRRRRALSVSPGSSPLARGSGPRPAPTGLWKRTRIKRRNAARKASEFVRAYGSRRRVAWVKRRPCIVAVGICGGPIENAHVVKGDGGTSYKASAEFIAPMCHRHHRRLHSLGPITFQSVYKVDLAAEAERTNAVWLAHVGAAAA